MSLTVRLSYKWLSKVHTCCHHMGLDSNWNVRLFHLRVQDLHLWPISIFPLVGFSISIERRLSPIFMISISLLSPLSMYFDKLSPSKVLEIQAAFQPSKFLNFFSFESLHNKNVINFELQLLLNIKTLCNLQATTTFWNQFF